MTSPSLCPVRNNATRVWWRLVTSLRGLRVIVVDDGSACPVESQILSAHTDIEVPTTPHKGFCRVARNTGPAACNLTDFVALDSDVTPRRGWLESYWPLAIPPSHWVAPRIVSWWQNLGSRYEALHLVDLGQREAPVLLAFERARKRTKTTA